MSPDELYLAHLNSKSQLGLLLSEIDSAVLRFAETPDEEAEKRDKLLNHDVIFKWISRRDEILMSVTEKHIKDRSESSSS